MTLKERLFFFGLADITVIEKDETTSTNTDCKKLLLDDPDSPPILMTAAAQTGGRGRQGKQFSSPRGGLYMTLTLRPETAFSNAVRMTAAASVAVCRALRQVCDLSCGIKWVNDIYVNSKKLCGILTEAVNDYTAGTTRQLIIGIGVNLVEYPEGIHATSVLHETGRHTDRNELCAVIVRELFDLFGQIKRGDFSYMEEYRRCSCVIGREVRLIRQTGDSFGKAVGIDDDGGLLVTFPDGHTETLTGGEITLRVQEKQ